MTRFTTIAAAHRQALQSGGFVYTDHTRAGWHVPDERIRDAHRNPSMRLATMEEIDAAMRDLGVCETD